MTRKKGTAKLAASLEVEAGAPLDARDIVPTESDKLDATNFPYPYIGMKTTVLSTGKTYRLIDMDVTDPDSWVEDSGETAIRQDISNIKAAIGYSDDLSNLDIVGLRIDSSNRQFKRLGCASSWSPYWPSVIPKFDDVPAYKFRRCTVSDDGTVTAYAGDPGYTEDGSAGQVMVEIPCIYYKVVPLERNTIYRTYNHEHDSKTVQGYAIPCVNIYATTTERPGFKVHPAFVRADGTIASKLYVGAFKAIVYEKSTDTYYGGIGTPTDYSQSVLCSVVRGLEPCLNLQWDKVETLASNRGTGWHAYTSKVHSLLTMLMLIECDGDSMSVYSGFSGVYNTDGQNYVGDTAGMGNSTGTATVNRRTGAAPTDGNASFSWRGIENPYGESPTCLQDMLIQSSDWYYESDSSTGKYGTQMPFVSNNFTYGFGGQIDLNNYTAIGIDTAFSYSGDGIGTGYAHVLGYPDITKEQFDYFMLPVLTTDYAESAAFNTYNTRSADGFKRLGAGGWYDDAINYKVGMLAYSDVNAWASNSVFATRLIYIPNN